MTRSQNLQCAYRNLAHISLCFYRISQAPNSSKLLWRSNENEFTINKIKQAETPNFTWPYHVIWRECTSLIETTQINLSAKGKCETNKTTVQLIIRGSKDQQIAKWGTRDTTFPAKGILKGSVQNIPRRERASNDVLTAMDNSIGNSGGITEVMISEQPSKSLYLLRVGSSRPCKGVSHH